jgi:hypothetical protein
VRAAKEKAEQKLKVLKKKRGRAVSPDSDHPTRKCRPRTEAANADAEHNEFSAKDIKAMIVQAVAQALSREQGTASTLPAASVSGFHDSQGEQGNTFPIFLPVN